MRITYEAANSIYLAWLEDVGRCWKPRSSTRVQATFLQFHWPNLAACFICVNHIFFLRPYSKNIQNLNLSWLIESNWAIGSCRCWTHIDKSQMMEGNTESMRCEDMPSCTWMHHDAPAACQLSIPAGPECISLADLRCTPQTPERKWGRWHSRSPQTSRPHFPMRTFETRRCYKTKPMTSNTNGFRWFQGAPLFDYTLGWYAWNSMSTNTSGQFCAPSPSVAKTQEIFR